MITLLSCECSSTEPLMRGLIQEAGIADWMTVEVHKGKEHCQTIIDQLPTRFHSLLAYRALQSYLSPDNPKSVSSFAIIVGYDKDTFYWEDFASNAPDARIKALAIAKRFA